jgi:small subunit ribosomal protein S20
MAHTLSSKKRIRQNEKKRALNRWRLRGMRGAIKEFHQKLSHGTVDEAKEAFRACVSVIDRTAQKGVIHRNQAARRKSRLNARLKARDTAKA